MDTDHDSQLKYRDFCNLCAEQVLQAPTSRGDMSMLGSSKAPGSEFSKIIKQLKSKNPYLKNGRGGPNFIGKRGSSAHQNSQSFRASKTVDQMVNKQPFVSSDLHRFIVNTHDLPAGHQVHSPQHNRYDSIRDDSVYKSIGADPPVSEWSRSVSTSLNKLRNKLQAKTHGLTSAKLAESVDPRMKSMAGQMSECINYDYERDYILEAMM